MSSTNVHPYAPLTPFSPGPNFLYMSPLIMLVAIPMAYGIFGVKKARLRSPIHFQQGTLGTSAWRAALSMALIAIIPFTIWTHFVNSASALLYLLGCFKAILLVTLTTSNILHYIPSPSVYKYIALRFHSRHLRHLLSALQLVVSVVSSYLLLHFCSLSIALLTTLPVQALTPLLAFSSLFAVLFSGQSNIMTPIFVVALTICAAGLGMFIYFSVEDVTSLQALLPLRFSIAPSLFSFVLGFLFTLYQLTASPTVYQLYFSLSTRHKLRLCFILYGVFLLVSGIFIFLLSSLYGDFLSRNCHLTYSLSSLFQFIKYTLHPHSFLSYAVCAALHIIPLTILQLILLSSTSHLWEEFARGRFSSLSAGKQLAVLQVTTFLLCVLLTASVLLLEYFRAPFHLIVPLVFYFISCLTTIIATAFLVGHYLPFSNSKGSLSAFLLTLLLLIALSSLHLLHNHLPVFESICKLTAKELNGEQKSVSLDVAGPLLARFVTSVSQLPLYTHPLLLSTFYLLSSSLVSWATGGEDLFVLDWNLVVYVCSPFSPPLGKRRSFVESESFRYAQQRNTVRYPVDRQFLYG